MAITKKQEIFCQEVVNQDSQSDAYRIAYSTKRMTAKQIHEEASKLMKNPKVSQRLNEIKKTISEKKLYTLERSVKRDLNLIERYEAALEVLENKRSTLKSLETAERTIKFIGAQGYNAAQDRLSKQHGFFERHNNQKTALPLLFLMPERIKLVKIGPFMNLKSTNLSTLEFNPYKQVVNSLNVEC